MNNVEYCNLKKITPVKIEDFESVEQITEALANKARLAILYALNKYGELCACEIIPSFKLAQPTITLHLQKLYNAGLLKKREEWKYTYYSIKDEYLQFVRTVLELNKKSKL
ncbi:MAG: metalloregulator ArsR/SmtB family transcription factor [Thermoplasmata archaeon]